MNDFYALVVGHGRSGTNWLLELFDQSEQTHCRNEPNEITDSPLGRLPSPEVGGGLEASFAGQWDAAVRWARSRMGVRDAHVPCRKSYLWEPVRRFGGARAVQGPRLRKLLSRGMGRLRQPEWFVPWWLGSVQRMSHAPAVLKLVQAPAWAAWVLEHRPNVPVLHIVRHPGGFLNSWSNRYLDKHERREVSMANIRRLRAVAAAEPWWAERMGDVDAMPAEVSELWYWRYASELIHRSGQGQPQYELIVYEDMVNDPVGVMHRLYDKVGLAWTDKVDHAIRTLCETSQEISDKWRQRLTATELQVIDQVLSDSPMRAWWPVAQPVEASKPELVHQA